MKRYLYFADGNGANATNESYTANADNAIVRGSNLFFILASCHSIYYCF